MSNVKYLMNISEDKELEEIDQEMRAATKIYDEKKAFFKKTHEVFEKKSMEMSQRLHDRLEALGYDFNAMAKDHGKNVGIHIFINKEGQIMYQIESFDNLLNQEGVHGPL